LPFENRSAEPDDLYFTDGIHEDVLTQLGRIGSLLVISRTSVMSYRDSANTLPEIAKELGVAHLEAIPTHNLEAYDAYLLGRRHLATRRADEMVRAREYFERAVRLDPTFALAYSGLAECLLLFTAYGPREANTNRAITALIADAEAAARKALELNPDLGEAHTAYGLVMNRKGDPPTDYGPSLQRGVELAPNSADARKWYAGYLSELNRKEEALEQYRKAAELDPMSPIIRLNFSGALWDLGRYEEARVQSRRALEIDPRFEPALYSDWESGEIEEILQSLSRNYLGTVPGDG
jgi:tetratricopeptide (TPR) repeat protein